MTKEELIEHARAMKTYCEQNKCENCPFAYADLKGCTIANRDYLPCHWILVNTQTHEKD